LRALRGFLRHWRQVFWLAATSSTASLFQGKGEEKDDNRLPCGSEKSSSLENDPSSGGNSRVSLVLY
jgi:hypothetical protein